MNREHVRVYIGANQIIQSNKWHLPQRNLQVGDLVIMKDEQTPATYWPLARVAAILSNRSGLVRSVSIKTAESSFDRPNHNLIYLPFSKIAQQAYLSVFFAEEVHA